MIEDFEQTKLAPLPEKEASEKKQEEIKDLDIVQLEKQEPDEKSKFEFFKNFIKEESEKILEFLKTGGDKNKAIRYLGATLAALSMNIADVNAGIKMEEKKDTTSVVGTLDTVVSAENLIQSIINKADLTAEAENKIIEQKIAKGERVIINDTLFAPDNDISVYFNTPNFNPEEHQNESYYYGSKEKILMHSGEVGKIGAEFLPGNEFFDMKEREYAKDKDGNFVKFQSSDQEQGFLSDDYGFKYKEVPANNEMLKITSSGGDIVEIINRSKDGLVPELLHEFSPGGKTVVQNGRLNFVLMDRSEMEPEKISFDFKAKQDSVPLKIKTGDEIIKINSSNRFTLSENGLKDYDKDGFVIDEKIKDNEMQVLDQLRIKYPSVVFDLPDQFDGSFNELKRVTPDTIQLLDCWFEKTGAQKRYSSVIFTGKFSSFVRYDSSREEKNILMIGVRTIDPYGEKIRDNNSFDILKHEDDHSQDHIIAYQEYKKLNTIKASKQLEKYIKEKKELNQLKRKEDLLRIFLPKKFKNKDEEINLNILKIENTIEKELDANPETKKLQNFYNEMVKGAAIDFLKNEKKFLGSIRQRVADCIVNVVKEKFNFELDKNDILNTKKGRVDIFKNFSKDKLFEAQPVINLASSVSYFEPHLLDLIIEDQLKAPEYVFSFSEQLLVLPELKDVSKDFSEVLESYGFPSGYGLRNYCETEREFFACFRELSSTYTEESFEMKKQKINSENKRVSEMYKKLTQLAYDAGKIGEEEYKNLMGDNAKEKCSLYKLTCEK